mgnify:CR=1 FL=1
MQSGLPAPRTPPSRSCETRERTRKGGQQEERQRLGSRSGRGWAAGAAEAAAGRQGQQQLQQQEHAWHPTRDRQQPPLQRAARCSTPPALHLKVPAVLRVVGHLVLQVLPEADTVGVQANLRAGGGEGTQGQAVGGTGLPAAGTFFRQNRPHRQRVQGCSRAACSPSPSPSRWLHPPHPLRKEVCPADEVGKGLVGDDALGHRLAQGEPLGLLLVAHLQRMQ